jgi:hypothetical protein
LTVRARAPAAAGASDSVRPEYVPPAALPTPAGNREILVTHAGDPGTTEGPQAGLLKKWS